jgi:NAD-dependent DNA ligase
MAETEASAAKRIMRLRREIEEHNRRYYEENAPTISDRDFLPRAEKPCHK